MNQPDDILTLLEHGLKSVSTNQTMTLLGNRQTYLGISDLAQGLFCPRAVLANKLDLNDSDLTLKNLLTMERGHWLEHGIEKAFKATGVNLISQLEISVIHQVTPVKAHLDFVTVDQAGNQVTVIELKSLGRIK
jgi:hypothetical protein